MNHGKVSNFQAYTSPSNGFKHNPASAGVANKPVTGAKKIVIKGFKSELHNLILPFPAIHGLCS